MKKFAIRNLKRLYRIIISISYLKKLRFIFQQFNNNSDAAVVYAGGLKEFLTNQIQFDLILVSAIQSLGVSVKLIRKAKIDAFKGRFVFYNPDEILCPAGEINYPEYLGNFAKNLENNGKIVCYSSREIVFWENKTFMYEEFARLNIPHPKTWIIKPISQFIPPEIQFPFLIKEEHSNGSLGVHKIADKEAFSNLVTSNSFRENNNAIIIQELINMRKDFRLIFVGAEIVLHYWRENPSEEWKPTSTMYGSKVDFTFFPEKWRALLCSINEKLNLSAAAYDVAWNDDNLENCPLILEVSPYFSPNPPINLPLNVTYGKYKKKLLLKNSWDSLLLKQTFEIKKKQVNYILNKKA